MRDRAGTRRVATTCPAADAGGLVDLRHRHEPGRPRDLRLPPPRPEDLSARHRPEPLRAEERLPARRRRSTSDGGRPSGTCSRHAGSTRRSSAARAPIRPTRSAGRMLSGMGVPDLRGGFGTATFYTSAETPPGPGERERRPVRRRSRRRRSPPTSSARATRRTAPTSSSRSTIHLDPDARTRRSIRSDGHAGRAGGPRRAMERLAAGQLQGRAVPDGPGDRPVLPGPARAGVRALRLAGQLRPRVSRVPDQPPRRITPASWPRRIGPFHTTGMVEDHAGLNNGRFDEAAFLDQCDIAWREREAMLLHELDGSTRGCSTASSTRPTASSTCSGGIREPDHPANRGEAPSPSSPGDRGPVSPRRRDGRQGPGGRRRRDAGDRPQRPRLRQLPARGSPEHLAARQRLARPPRGVEPGEAAGDCSARSTGSRTRAYALGLGGIYLNLEGREGEGIVAADEAESLKAAIARGLSGLVDPARRRVGRPRRQDPRRGLLAARSSARRPTCSSTSSKGYRVSWALDGRRVAEAQFEDNSKKWSGDHIVDPALVPGVLFMNRPFRRRRGPARSTWPRRSSTRSGSRRARPWKGVRCSHEDPRHRTRLRRPRAPLRRRAAGQHPPPDGRRLLTGGWRASSRRSPCPPGCAWRPARTPARWASTASATGSIIPTTAWGSSSRGRSAT